MNVLAVTLGATAALAAGGAVWLLVLRLWPERLVAEAARRGGGGAAARSLGGVLVDRAAAWNERVGFVRDDQALRRRFVMMGRPELTAARFRVWQEAAAISFALFGLTLAAALARAWLLPLLLGAGGFFFPFVWLRDRIKRRHRDIERALPYNLDLLTLSVEAGLDFPAALATVVDKGRKGALTEELGLTINEIRLGKTREEALRNLADRVRLPPLSAFVSNLIQADRMGTSLGKVLRIQATQMRTDRSHRAEKLANEAPVKMLFPLILCIFPTVLFVILSPIVYRVMHGVY